MIAEGFVVSFWHIKQMNKVLVCLRKTKWIFWIWSSWILLMLREKISSNKKIFESFDPFSLPKKEMTRFLSSPKFVNFSDRLVPPIRYSKIFVVVKLYSKSTSSSVVFSLLWKLDSIPSRSDVNFKQSIHEWLFASKPTIIFFCVYSY